MPAKQLSLQSETFTTQTAGYLPAGTYWSTWIFSSSFAGTVQGVTFVGGTDTSIHFPNSGDGEDSYGEIYYTRTAGTLRCLSAR